jgi:CRP-like cAMP-binding protein
MYIVMEGKLEILLWTRDEVSGAYIEKRVRVLGRGESLGEQALISNLSTASAITRVNRLAARGIQNDGGRRTASARAIGAVTVMVLAKVDFMALIEWWPDFFQEMKEREQHMYNFGFHLPLFSSMANSARNMVMSSLKKIGVKRGQVSGLQV